MDLVAFGCTVPTGSDFIVTLSCAEPIIINALSWLFAFAGIVTLFFVVFGGFKFLTSGGEKEKVEGARKTITWALIGLIVIFLSFGIVRLIGQVTGVSCISGPFKFSRCGIPENKCDTGLTPVCNGGAQPICNGNKWDCGDSGAACLKIYMPDCGKDRFNIPRDPLCDPITGNWSCTGGT